MLRQLDKIAIILALGFGCLVLNNGCYDTRVTVGEEPTYRHAPPPPEETGPPRGHGPPPWAPAHGYRAKYRYHYYPSSYVYYDLGRKLYFYYDGGNWQVSVSLPAIRESPTIIIRKWSRDIHQGIKKRSRRLKARKSKSDLFF